MSQPKKERNNKPCIICLFPIADRAHIKSKGSGGTWDDENILSLCRSHHREQHSVGWKKLCSRYPIVEYELNRWGWELVEEFRIWKLRKTAK